MTPAFLTTGIMMSIDIKKSLYLYFIEDDYSGDDRTRSRHGTWRHLTQNDHAENLVLRHILSAGMADHLAVFHDEDPVRQIEDVVNIVADEEDADALPF